MPLISGSRSAGSPDLPPMKIIVGQTSAMKAILNKLEHLGQTDVPVLLQGESGTGKEIWARLLHNSSQRPTDSLVKVSCPAIPLTLFESELFGYERGAFTGAQSSKRGRVEQAHQGTLLLDEVGSLDISVQAKMLQVLEDGTFVRVGGHELRRVATRLISTANRDLRGQVAEGTFRLDFLFRINAVTITLPPLWQRVEDIPALIDYFLEQHAMAFRLSPKPLSKIAVRAMQIYHWPGNIRQLENLIRTYVLLGSEETLIAELMPEMSDRTSQYDFDPNEPISLKHVTKKATQDLERQIIFKVLEANLWNRRKTAESLKISYRSLLYKLTAAGPPSMPAPSARVTALAPNKDCALRPTLADQRGASS
jgi:two-component system, NtrC family, response regulator AtoC